MGLRDVVQKRRDERKPKTLAELRAMKQAQPPPAVVRTNGLAALRASKRAKLSSKLDFHRAGLRYHNVQQIHGYWTIDVSNGDRTYTMHNRYGAWYHDIAGSERMAEPVKVARALGTEVSQLDMSLALQARLHEELKDRGIPTHAEIIQQHDEEAKKKRKQSRKSKEAPDDAE
jgi:hypothetical protein